VIAWFLLFLVMAVLMFGSLFVAIGAACTDIKETQNLLLPVMLLATFPLFFLTKIIEEPDGAIATVLSFFPFATPSIMVARLAIPPGAPSWQPILGVAVVVVTALLCVWIAGRIFRVGLLMQGKGASFKELITWVWKG
jgi:ABC-type Na+ efflux pump permease subunit